MLSGSITIHKLMESMGRLDASDLHIKVGIPPTYRISGDLKPIQADPLTDDEADHLLAPLLDERLRSTFEDVGNVDFAQYSASGDRFRINVFRAGGHMHAAIRRVQAKIPDFETLHLPPIYEKLVERTHEGLVLVVGVTGSGKSSTLAAMIDFINHRRAVNIITIEDPVEYRFTCDRSIISQREIGIDVQSFPIAMRAVVREDPDVILVGEMRDHETVLAAIQAAETGHLVFATLHTADTMQAFGRILEFFPEEERGFLRSALASSLKAICAQRLLPAHEEFEVGMVPATEVLLSSSTVREKIREGEEEDLPAIINSSTGEGMHSFTHSLSKLVEKEWVSRSEAMDAAPNREALDSALKGVQVKAQTLVHRVKG